MAWHDFDILGVVGLVIVIIGPLFAYYRILCVSYANLQPSTLRIQLLSTRTAIFLPVYSVIIWVSLVAPILYVPLEVPTALAEGYCFYCFFTMVVTNLGGPSETVAVMEETGRRPLCPCCCPSTPPRFYKRVQSGLFHMLWTRTAVVLASAVCTMVAHKSQTYHNPAFLASLILTVCSLLLLINGFASLVLFYEVLMSESTNLLGTCKIILLKISVGLIVIQGLIEEFLFAFGVIKIGNNSSFTGEERAQRFYCFIVLVEYALLSFAVYYAYAAEIKPNQRNSKVRITSVLGEESSSSQSSLSNVTTTTTTTTISDAILFSNVINGGEDVGGGVSRRPPLTFWEFLCGVFRFSDVFYGMGTGDMERALLSSGPPNDSGNIA